MNCEKFELLVTDLARGQLIETGLREEATSHTKACASCAGRFEQEQNLSVALKALALLDENQKANRQLEANLLGAFRNRTKSLSAQAEAATQQAQVMPMRRKRVYWWAAAAAALILIALTLFAWRVQNHQSTPQPQAHEVVQPQAPDNQNPQNQTAKQTDKVIGEKRAGFVDKQKTGGLPGRKAIHQTAKLNSRPARDGRQPHPDGLAGKAAEEIATSFITLYDIPMTEGGQLMRVELPRSALATFGLPVNAALADKPIKADVVIGNDGIARAIRFVQ